jgi:hypothetical protein
MIRRALAGFVASLLLASLASPVLAAELEDLEEIAELQALFNKDHGTARVILLLSPT